MCTCPKAPASKLIQYAIYNKHMLLCVCLCDSVCVHDFVPIWDFYGLNTSLVLNSSPHGDKGLILKHFNLVSKWCYMNKLAPNVPVNVNVKE